MLNFSQPRFAGIAISQDRVDLAVIRKTKAGWRNELCAQRDIAIPLFRGAPGSAHRQALAEALGPIAEAIRREYVPAHVSVPDAFTHCQIVELDALPKSEEELAGLIGFRVAREMGRNNGFTSAAQSLAKVDGKHVVFGMAMDTPWLDVLVGALRDSQIQPWSIGPALKFHFNLFHDLLTENSGALIAVEDSCWSIALWNGAGQLRYVAAHWRSSSGSAVDAAEAQQIAADAMRTVLVFIDAHPGVSVERVFIAGRAANEQLQAALDRRLREPCRMLVLQERAAFVDPPESTSGALPLALSHGVGA